VFYRSLTGQARAVKIVFGVMIAVSVLAALSDLLEWLLLNRMIAGDPVADSTLHLNDARQALMGLLQLAAFIACWIAFIIWIYAAYGNVDVISRGTRRYDRGWAIGAWFVPILNFFRPKQIYNDIYRAAGGRPEASPLVLAWWIMWLVSNLVGNVAARSQGGDTPEELRSGTIVNLVSDLLDVPAAVLAMLVVMRATQLMDRRAAELPPSPPWQPAPQPVSA
jgi:hypothetical protein